MLEEDEGDGTVQGVAVLVQYVKNIKIMRGETEVVAIADVHE